MNMEAACLSFYCLSNLFIDFIKAFDCGKPEFTPKKHIKYIVSIFDTIKWDFLEHFLKKWISGRTDKMG